MAKQMLEAAMENNVPLLRSLHKRGVRICDADMEGGLRTTLMSAAIRDSAEAVQFLAENGANINAVSYDGQTALVLAIQMGAIRTALYLIGRGAHYTPGLANEVMPEVVFQAANNDVLYEQLLEALLANESSLTWENPRTKATLLSEAISARNPNVIDYLLTYPQVITQLRTHRYPRLHMSPIGEALIHSPLILKILLSAGANARLVFTGLFNRSATYLEAALELDEEYIKPLVESGANPYQDRPGKLTPVKQAIQNQFDESPRIKRNSGHLLHIVTGFSLSTLCIFKLQTAESDQDIGRLPSFLRDTVQVGRSLAKSST
jgi:ankyrin repeat protein